MLKDMLYEGRGVKLKTRLITLSIIMCSFLVGCTSSEETFDQRIKDSLEDGEAFALTIEGSTFLSFEDKGLTYYGIDTQIDRYTTQFTHMETYADYTMSFDEEEELLTIAVEEGEYQLIQYGPRVFRDPVNAIDLTSTIDLLSTGDYIL